MSLEFAHDIEKTPNLAIRIDVSNFTPRGGEARDLLHMREHKRNEEGELRPTQKGFTMPPTVANCDSLIAGLKKAKAAIIEHEKNQETGF